LSNAHGASSRSLTQPRTGAHGVAHGKTSSGGGSDASRARGHGAAALAIALGSGHLHISSGSRDYRGRHAAGRPSKRLCHRTVEPFDRVTIKAKAAGAIDLKVREGSRVNKGDLLAVIRFTRAAVTSSRKGRAGSLGSLTTRSHRGAQLASA